MTFNAEYEIAKIKASGGKIPTTPTTHKGGQLYSLTKRFCRTIADTTPIFMPYTMLPALVTAELNGHSVGKGHCHSNVAWLVKKYGGSAQYGWLIWQDANHVLDAEFHCIWRNDGMDFDVSPRLGEEELVLFLPDPVRTFDWTTMTTYCNRTWYPQEHKYLFMDFAGNPTKQDRFVLGAAARDTMELERMRQNGVIIIRPQHAIP